MGGQIKVEVVDQEFYSFPEGQKYTKILSDKGFNNKKIIINNSQRFQTYCQN